MNSTVQIDMQNPTPNENNEEVAKQAKDILKRCRRYSLTRAILLFAPIPIIYYLLPHSSKLEWKLSHAFFSLTSPPALFMTIFWFTRKFARRLTSEEIRILRVAEQNQLESNSVISVAVLLKSIEPEKLLLRPSNNNSDDGTLLRATASDEKTGREHLLRPVEHSTEETQSLTQN